MIDRVAVKNFLEDRIIIDTGARIDVDVVWEQWQIWCARKKKNSSKKKQFSQALKSEGIWFISEWIDTGSERLTRYSWGCRLKEESHVS